MSLERRLHFVGDTQQKHEESCPTETLVLARVYYTCNKLLVLVGVGLAHKLRTRLGTVFSAPGEKQSSERS